MNFDIKNGVELREADAKSITVNQLMGLIVALIADIERLKREVNK